jgi:polar amino acid transport system substrate-binding protein
MQAASASKLVARAFTTIKSLPLVLALSFAGHHSRAEQFRIVHADPFPPFMEVKSGESEGLGVDILRSAATRAGISLQFLGAPLDRLEQSLDEGRGDGLFIRITSEGHRSFDFSAPVLTTGSGLFVRAPNAAPHSLATISGKVVATPRAGPLATLVRQSAPSVKLLVTADYEETLARVVAGDADAAALNFHAGRVVAARSFGKQITVPDQMFATGQLAVAVRKGQLQDFLAQLSSGLAMVRADGTSQQIEKRWLAK